MSNLIYCYVSIHFSRDNLRSSIIRLSIQMLMNLRSSIIRHSVRILMFSKRFDGGKCVANWGGGGSRLILTEMYPVCNTLLSLSVPYFLLQICGPHSSTRLNLKAAWAYGTLRTEQVLVTADMFSPQFLPEVSPLLM